MYRVHYDLGSLPNKNFGILVFFVCPDLYLVETVSRTLCERGENWKAPCWALTVIKAHMQTFVNLKLKSGGNNWRQEVLTEKIFNLCALNACITTLSSCIMGNVGSSVLRAWSKLETKVRISESLLLQFSPIFFSVCLMWVPQLYGSAILNCWSAPLSAPNGVAIVTLNLHCHINLNFKILLVHNNYMEAVVGNEFLKSLQQWSKIWIK